MTTHEKLARILHYLRAGPKTIDDLAAAVEYHPDGVRRFLRALQAEGIVEPRGVKDYGARGSKPIMWRMA